MTVDAVAHIAGVPLEEAVLPVLSGIGTGLLVVRAWLTSRVRRRDRDAPTAPARHTGARSAASFVRGRGAEIVEEAEPTAEELAERLGGDRTGRAEWRRGGIGGDRWSATPTGTARDRRPAMSPFRCRHVPSAPT